MSPARPIRETPKTIQATTMRTGQRWIAGDIRLAVASRAWWLGACGGSGGGGPDLRERDDGPLRGVDDGAATGTYYWKGVPFAQARGGALRWQRRVEPKAWEGVREARQFGNADRKSVV